MNPSNLIKQLIAESDLKAIERIGKNLSFVEMKDILDEIHEKTPFHIGKVDALFIGFEPDSFRKLMIYSSLNQLSTIGKLAEREAVQHHLSTLCYSLKKETIDLETEVYLSINKCTNLEMENLTIDEIKSLIKSLEDLDKSISNHLQLIEMCQKIIWHIGRIDLLEILNYSKQVCEKLFMEEMGHPGDYEAPPTGIWNILQHRLYSVFEEPQCGMLPDETPVMEALTRFSIWYIKDYWDLKLLSQIKTEKELNRYLKPEADIERQELFTSVQNKLNQCGLVTLRDLKKNYIFSKNILYEFIKSAFKNK